MNLRRGFSVCILLFFGTINVLFFQNCGKIMVGAQNLSAFGEPVVPFQISDDFFVGSIHNLDYTTAGSRIEIEAADPFQPVGLQQIYFNLHEGPRTNLTPYYTYKLFFDDDDIEDFGFISDVHDSQANTSFKNLYVYSGATGNRIYEKYYDIELPMHIGDINHDGRPEVVSYRYDTRLYYLFTIDPENQNYRQALKQDERLYKYRKNGQEYDITNYLYFESVIPDINGNGYEEFRFSAYYMDENDHQDFIALIVDSKDMDINNPLFTYVEEYTFTQAQQTQFCYPGLDVNYCKFNIAINYRDRKLYVTGKTQLKIYAKQTDNSFVLERSVNYPAGYRAIRNDYYRPRNDIQFDQDGSPKFMIQLQNFANGQYRQHVAWFDRSTNTFDLSVSTQIREITQCGSDCFIGEYEIHKRAGKTYLMTSVGQPGWMGFQYILNLTDGTQVWKGKNYSSIWNRQLFILHKREE